MVPLGLLRVAKLEKKALRDNHIAFLFRAHGLLHSFTISDLALKIAGVAVLAKPMTAVLQVDKLTNWIFAEADWAEDIGISAGNLIGSDFKTKSLLDVVSILAELAHS